MVNRTLQYGLLLLITAVSLLFWHGTTEVYGLVKIVTLETGVLLLFCLWLTDIAGKLKNRSRTPFFIIVGPLGWAVVAFIAAGWVSLTRAVNAYEGIQALTQWSAGAVLFFVVLNNVTAKKQINNILIVLALSGLLACLYSLYQIQTVSFKLSRLAYISTFGNPVFFSQYLAAVIPFACVLFIAEFRREKKRRKAKRVFLILLYGICAAVMTTMLFLSRCRGAFIGLAAAAVYCCAVWALFFSRKQRKIILGFLGGFAIVAVIAGLVLLPQLKGYLGENIKARNLMRVHVWKSTAEMIAEHPFLGVGAGNFKTVYPLYRSPEERKITPPGVKYSKAHNDFLQIWAETGVIGFICFGLILFFLARYSVGALRLYLKKYSRFSPWTLFAVGIQASLVAILCQSLVNPVLQTPASGMLFWLALGLAAVLKEKEDPAKPLSFKIALFGSLSGKDFRRIGVLLYVFVGLMLVYLPVKIIRPLAADYFLEQASRQFSQGNARQAMTLLNKSTEYYPFNLEAYFLGGRISQREGRYPEAVDFYKQTLRFGPHSATVWNNLGTAYLQAGNPEKGRDSFLRAIDINTEFEGAFYNLAIAYEQTGREEEAEQAASRLRELNPNFLGNIHLKKGLHDKAVWEYYKAVRRDPQNVEAVFKLADIWRKEGELEKAEDMYKRAVGLKEDYVAAHQGLALLYKNSGRPHKAIVEYEEVLKSIPEETQSIFDRISYLSEGGFFKQVIEEHAKIEELEQKKIRILKELINMYRVTGDSEAALKTYRDIIESGGQSSSVLRELAQVYRSEGMYKEARQVYAKILKADPGNKIIESRMRGLELVSASHALADIYLEQGLRDKAVSEYRKALSVDPADTNTFFCLVRLLKKTGRLGEAEALLINRPGGYNDNPKICLELADLYRQAERFSKAEAMYKRVIELNPYDTSIYLTLGSFYRTIGRVDSAEQMYRKAVEVEDKNIRAHLALGVLLQNRGDLKQARREFKAVLDIQPDNQQAYALREEVDRILNGEND